MPGEPGVGKRFNASRTRVAALFLGVCGIALLASETAANGGDAPTAASLKLPALDPKRGRQLFVSKGCVVCHAVNGVGGMTGAPLDAATMDPAGNPFEFFSRMWLGIKPMIEMQERKLGQQIEFTAQELADIVAFVNSADEQRNFSAGEIPEIIEELMEDD